MDSHMTELARRLSALQLTAAADAALYRAKACRPLAASLPAWVLAG